MICLFMLHICLGILWSVSFVVTSYHHSGTAWSKFL
nr:MAG TPA: hypothetical protein [Caudoviricetes sp.]